jgi:uncharacterized protein YukE
MHHLPADREVRMTPELIAAIGPYVAPLLVALGGFVAIWTKRDQLFATTQKSMSEMAFAEVQKAVAEERKTYTNTLAEMRREIVRLSQALEAAGLREVAHKEQIDDLTREVMRLRDALGDVPAMVEQLAIAIARFNPDATPTASQMSEFRRRAAALGLTPEVANGIALTRAES